MDGLIVVDVDPDIPSLRMLLVALDALAKQGLADYDKCMKEGEYSDACHTVIGVWSILVGFVNGNVEGIELVHEKVCTHE